MASDEDKKKEKPDKEELERKKLEYEIEEKKRKLTFYGKLKEAILSVGFMAFLLNLSAIIALSFLAYLIFTQTLVLFLGEIGVSLAFFIALTLFAYLIYKFASSKNTVQLIVITVFVFLLQNYVIPPVIGYVQASVVPEPLRNAFFACLASNYYNLLDPNSIIECSKLLTQSGSVELKEEKVEKYYPLKLSVDGALLANSNSVFTLTFKNSNKDVEIKNLMVDLREFVALAQPRKYFKYDISYSFSACENIGCNIPPLSEKVVVFTVEKNEQFCNYSGNVFLIGFDYSYENSLKSSISLGVARNAYVDAPEFRNNVERVEIAPRDLEMSIKMFPGYMNIDKKNYNVENGYPEFYLVITLKNSGFKMATVYLGEMSMSEIVNDIIDEQACLEELKNTFGQQISFRDELALACRIPLKLTDSELSNLDSFLITELNIEIPYKVEKTYSMRTTIQDICQEA